jgi:hypothetical protein
MLRKLTIACLVSMFMAGLCFSFGTVNDKVVSLSLMKLIVNPEKYHGEIVRVIGVSVIEGDVPIVVEN